MRVIFLLILFLGMSGCRRRDPLVAKVGALAVSKSEFHRKLSEVAQSYQNYVITPNGRRQFLDILIREKMILAAAQASEVRKSPQYRAQLAQLKAEEAERVREGSEYLLTRFWLEDLRQKGALKAGEDEARDYYRKHPAEVSVRHILIAAPNEAAEIFQRARGGASFAFLAKTKSLDAETAAAGGKMPPAIYGEIIPEMEDVVFHMRVGEISGPIKSKFGYHILKKESEKTVRFEAAEERILRLLEKQKLDKYLQSIQEKFPVEVIDEQFK